MHVPPYGWGCVHVRGYACNGCLWGGVWGCAWVWVQCPYLHAALLPQIAGGGATVGNVVDSSS